MLRWALVMGRRALEHKRATKRTIRKTPLSEGERSYLREHARYEGRAYHKGHPGDFGLTPPCDPRPDKTLCDKANVTRAAEAERLFLRAIKRGLASENEVQSGFPKYLWVVDDQGHVFELMYGGSHPGHYHGYPILQDDPLFDRVSDAWGSND